MTWFPPRRLEDVPSSTLFSSPHHLTVLVWEWSILALQILCADHYFILLPASLETRLAFMPHWYRWSVMPLNGSDYVINPDTFTNLALVLVAISQHDLLTQRKRTRNSEHWSHWPKYCAREESYSAWERHWLRHWAVSHNVFNHRLGALMDPNPIV